MDMEKSLHRLLRSIRVFLREIGIILACVICGAVVGIFFMVIFKIITAVGFYFGNGFDMLLTEIEYDIKAPKATVKESASFGAMWGFALYCIYRLQRAFNV